MIQCEDECFPPPSLDGPRPAAALALSPSYAFLGPLANPHLWAGLHVNPHSAGGYVLLNLAGRLSLGHDIVPHDEIHF